MSPNSPQDPGASTDETQAIREESQAAVGGMQQSDAARGSNHNVANREEAMLLSARESTQANAESGSQEESSDKTTGFTRRNLPMHDPIYVVFEEFKHDPDLPVQDPSRVQELAIENPDDPRFQKYLAAYFQLSATMKKEVPKIATPYKAGDSAQSLSRGSSATQMSSRTRVSIQDEPVGSRSRSPKVTAQRTSAVRSTTVPKSYGATETYDISGKPQPQTARESSRREKSLDASMSARESSRNDAEGSYSSTSARESSRKDPQAEDLVPSGFVMQALAEQKAQHQKEASDLVQAIAASAEQQTAQAVAQKEMETNQAFAAINQAASAQVFQRQQEAEKMMQEANTRAAEAERVNRELAEKFQMLHLQTSRTASQASVQSSENHSMRQLNAMKSEENDRLQKQLADMQKMMGSHMAQGGADQAQLIALQSSLNQKELVESMTRQTEMLQQQLVQEKMRADRERAEAAEKAEIDKKNWFSDMTAKIQAMVAQGINSGNGSESSWVHAGTQRDIATSARESARASKEYATSEGKSMFSFIGSNPNVDVPGPGFTQKGLGEKEDEKLYLKVSPLKILPLPAVAKFKEWKRNFNAEVAGATQTADEAFQWIGEVDDAEKWEDLDNPGKFAVLDSKRHVALLGVVTGDLKRQIQFEIEKLAKIKRLMRGRSIAWMIFKHFEISDQQLKIKSLNDLLCVGLQGDHIKRFLHDWDTIIEEMVEKASETMKQELFRRQVDQSTKLHDVLMHYDMVLDQSGETKITKD